MAKSSENIDSEILTIEEISLSSYQFNIPRYQRLYVWSDEQVDTLLEDLVDGFKSNNKMFYLGGILIVKSKIKEDLYDLIDGQQRFTTLWLLSLHLGNDLSSFMETDGNLRLRFSIREMASK